MKKRRMRKLSLNRETLRHLQTDEVRRAAGGATFEIDTTCADHCSEEGCGGGGTASCGGTCGGGCGGGTTGTCTQELITTCRC